jgi:hypothetical protein
MASVFTVPYSSVRRSVKHVYAIYFRHILVHSFRVKRKAKDTSVPRMQNSHQTRNLQLKQQYMDTTMQIVPKYKKQLLTLMYPCHMGRRWYTSDPIMLTYKHLSQ